MSLATRCPACGTIFRVVQDQLKVSEGWVRCGQCHEVFHGIEALFDLDSDPAIAARRAARLPAAPPPTRVFAQQRASAPIPIPTQAPTPPALAPTASTAPAATPPAPVVFPTRPSAPVTTSATGVRATPSAFGNSGQSSAPSPIRPGYTGFTPASGPSAAPSPPPAPLAPPPPAPSVTPPPAPLATSPIPSVATRGTIAPRFAARLAEEAARAQAAIATPPVSPPAPARAATPSAPIPFGSPPASGGASSGWQNLPPAPTPAISVTRAVSSTPAVPAAPVVAAPAPAAGPAISITPAVLPTPAAPVVPTAFAAPVIAATPAVVAAPEPAPIHIPPFLARKPPAPPAVPAPAPAAAAAPSPAPAPARTTVDEELPLVTPLAAPPTSQAAESASHRAAEFAAPLEAATTIPVEPSSIPEDAIFEEVEPAPEIGGPTMPSRLADAAADEGRAGPPTLASMLPEDAGEWPPKKAKKRSTDAATSELALVDRTRDPRFLREARSGARWRRPWVRAVLSVTLLLLVVAAAGQVAWPLRDTIAARWPVTLPAWNWVCEQADCKIEAPRAIASLALDGSSLTRTDTEHVLLFSADLHNRADHEVRMPSFDVTFMDLNGEIVARKILTPSQLGIRQAALPAEGELHVHARLQVGSLPASGFQADLFYP